MDEPNKCDCGYTLQSVEAARPVVMFDPVVTLGLIAGLMLVMIALSLAVYVHWRYERRGNLP